ncbi:hypothetical protein ACFL1A_00295 [Patescibacteria group bacterium]
MSEKIVGYLLLIAGIGIIGFSAFRMYSVFTGKEKPIQLFSFAGIGFNPADMVGGNIPAGVEIKGPGGGDQAKVELVGPEMINSTTNMFFHLMLMGFIASAGFKIASLGVQLIRPIKVKLRTKEEKKPLPKENIPSTPERELASSEQEVNTQETKTS